MKSIIEEYGVFIIEVIVGIAVIGLLWFAISSVGLGKIAEMIVNRFL